MTFTQDRASTALTLLAALGPAGPAADQTREQDRLRHPTANADTAADLPVEMMTHSATSTAAHARAREKSRDPREHHEQMKSAPRSVRDAAG